MCLTIKKAVEFQEWCSLLLAWPDPYIYINKEMQLGNTRQNEREIPTLPFLTFFPKFLPRPISNGRSLCLGFLYVIPYRHFSSLENMLEYWLLRMNEADNSEQSKDSRCKAKKKKLATGMLFQFLHTTISVAADSSTSIHLQKIVTKSVTLM